MCEREAVRAVCVCVCVWWREIKRQRGREREIEIETEKERQTEWQTLALGKLQWYHGCPNQKINKKICVTTTSHSKTAVSAYGLKANQMQRTDHKSFLWEKNVWSRWPWRRPQRYFRLRFSDNASAVRPCALLFPSGCLHLYCFVVLFVFFFFWVAKKKVWKSEIVFCSRFHPL